MMPGLLSVLSRRGTTAATPFTVWRDAIIAAGGTFETDSQTIAEALYNQLAVASYYSKIKWLVPFLGANLVAARMPLIDTLGVGIMGNTGFVDADFTQATGIKGNGSSKILNTLIKPSQLGASSSGGIGYWENDLDMTGSAVEPIGCYNDAGTSRFVLDLRSTFTQFSWGGSANGPFQLTTATNGHYYGQRSSSVFREYYKNASFIVSNTASDAATGASDRMMRLLGADESGSLFYWKGRCAVAYMTDGTLSGADVTAFHTLLNTYLITPTGR